MTAPAPARDGEFGDLLRYWRGRRRWSQLDLSLETGVSQRHISFIESGRSVPSRPMLLSLARELDIPLRERNSLLLAAGYAPLYPDDALDAPSMRRVTDALHRMLRQQEPFPALVMDRHWNVVMANRAAPKFLSRFVDLSRWPKPRNLLMLMFDPAALRPFLQNWDDVATSLLERLHRESFGRAADEKTRELLAALLAFPGVKPDWTEQPAAANAPTIPLTFRHGEGCLSFFSLVTTVGTPQTVTAQELRVECMFPADDATEQAYLALPED